MKNKKTSAPQGDKIERHFDENNNIVEYWHFPGLGPILKQTVDRKWAEDQVCRGKAHYVDVGRKPLPSE